MDGQHPTVGFRPSSYDPAIASARLRTFEPIRVLQAAGQDVQLVPPDGAGEWGCVVFQKAYSDADRALAERVHDAGGRVVFDLCDNHLYTAEGHRHLAARAALLTRMLEHVDAVTLSSPELAPLVAPKPTFVVDDCVDDVHLAPRLARRRQEARERRRRRGAALRLVWFGNSGSEEPPFGLLHVGSLVPRLEELHRQLPLELTIISNSRQAYEKHVKGAAFPTRYERWRARTFNARVTRHDVCILPVERNPFTVCKTSNRVITALMLGLPVVASSLPSYLEFEPWIGLDDWDASLRRCASDPAHAAEQVRAAQQHVRQTYTDDHAARQWSLVLSAVLADSHGP